MDIRTLLCYVILTITLTFMTFTFLVPHKSHITETEASPNGNITCYSGSRMIYNADFTAIKVGGNYTFVEVIEQSGTKTKVSGDCVVTYK